MSTSRCPSCGAALRPGAPWCLLCHRDLRPAPEPILAAVALAAVAPAAPQAGTPTDLAVSAKHAKGWPCAACGAANSYDDTGCTTCGVSFLAGLKEEGRAGLRLPLVGDIGRLSRSARLGLAVGVGLVASLLLSGLVVLAGKVLG